MCCFGNKNTEIYFNFRQKTVNFYVRPMRYMNSCFTYFFIYLLIYLHKKIYSRQF